MESNENQNDFIGFQCDICEEFCSRKDSLKRHYLLVHKQEMADEKSSNTKCFYPDCSLTFHHKTKLFEHMEKEHGANIESESHHFQSFKDFLVWKDERRC